MTKRAIGIVRVSRVGDREGERFASPGIQQGRIETECERLGIRLVAVHEELDISGGKPLDERPGLSRAVAAVERHEADVVMVAYFDRLARSLSTQTEVLQRIEDAGGDVMTLDHGTITNGGAAKRLEANIVGAMAQYFREQTAEKTAAAQSNAVARGVMPWPVVPAGYVRGADGVLAPDSTAPAVAHAYELRAEGRTVRDVRSYLNANGVPYGYHGVCKLLKNRIYLGELHFGQLVNLTAHPPLVDRALFDTVQRKVLTKGRLAKSDRLLARLGVLRCGTCNRALVVTSTGTRNDYPAYRCPPSCDCPHRVTIGAVIAEDYVSRTVRTALQDAQGRASIAESAQEAAGALARAQGDLDAALRVFSLTGAENEASAVERIGELRQTRDEAQAHLDQIGPQASRTVSASANWDNLNLAERRDLIRATVESATVAPGGRGAERIRVRLFGVE